MIMGKFFFYQKTKYKAADKTVRQYFLKELKVTWKKN